MDCVNLRERFGKQFRITFDPAYDHRHVPRKALDPWYMTMPCRGGIMIYPHGGTTLAVEVDRHPSIAKQIAALSSVHLHQDGDAEKEKTFLFNVAMFDQVASIVRPRRRRVLTTEQRQAATARLVLARKQISLPLTAIGRMRIETMSQ